MSEAHPGRVPMSVGFGQGIVWVPEESVDEKVAQGWTKYSRKSAPVTGATPTQRQSGN